MYCLLPVAIPTASKLTTLRLNEQECRQAGEPACLLLHTDHYFPPGSLMPGKLAGKGLAEDESQRLRTFVSLAEDPRSIPSTSMVTHNHL